MRKSDVEITREVFGKGSRWIGWNHWLRHQVFFKYLEKKVEEGSWIGCRADFYLNPNPVRPSVPKPETSEMIRVRIHKDTGGLEGLVIPSATPWSRKKGFLYVEQRSSIYFPDGLKEGVRLEEMFQDPWRPTPEELDLFELLYGDDQILIDMDKAFFSQVRMLEKTINKGNITTYYPQ